MPKNTTKKSGEISKKRLKKEKQKEANVGKTIAIFLIVLVVLGLSIGILFSPAFNLTEVLINDGTNVKAEEISSLIDVKYGENVLKQRYKKIKESVMSLPYVKEVKVTISFPDKIKISYVERAPYATIKFLETFFVTDSFGYLLEANKENKFPDLPILYGIELEGYELGNQLAEVPGLKYKNIVQLLETAKQKNIPYTINEIDYESASEVKLWIKESDIEIVYGEIKKEILIDKLNYLSEVMKTLIAEGKRGSVDVSSDTYLEETIFTDINNM